MALKPATKRVVISDESTNSHGFWTLSSGIDLTAFHSNPILLWNHNRPKIEGAKKDDVLPIGVMTNLAFDPSGVLTGLPAFDDSDAFAMSIYDKYESGILRMTSPGLEPIEVLTDKASMKGKGPCLSKSRMLEISITDIGSNRNAVQLYRENNLVELSSADDLIRLCFSPTNNDKMLVQLKDIKEILKLTEAATEGDILEAIKKQDALVIQLTNEKKTAEDALSALQQKVEDDKIVTLVAGAIAAQKIPAGEKDKYEKLAKADFPTVKSLLDGMKPYESVQTQLTNNSNTDTSIELAEILKLSNEDLWKGDRLERLKVLSEPHYKLKYKEIFGKEPA